MSLRSILPAAGLAIGLVGAATLAPTGAFAATGYPAHYSAPYLELSESSVGDLAADRTATGTKYYTLAFLIPDGGCKQIWEASGQGVGAFKPQIQALKKAGGDVAVSFGGAVGGEVALTCTSVTSLQAAYANVVKTYGITHLDFDIEESTFQNSAANARRNRALAALQAANPAVAVDFTLAVDPDGLPAAQLNLLKDAVAKGVKINAVNIMTMDFGDGENALKDAKSAANATHTQLAKVFPGMSSAARWNKLGLTPIAGQNDDDEFFSQADARSLETFAAAKGVQKLAFWEVDSYDKPAGWAYSRIFNRITGS
jgi:chitinase